MSRSRRRALVVLLLFAPLLVAWFSVRPRSDRAWTPDMAVLPHARFDGDSVHISAIRNADYRTTDDFTVRYYDRSFDLDELESVWYLVGPSVT